VRRLDSRVVDEMYYYGVCLKRQGKVACLKKLAEDLLRCNDQHPDPWCVQALYWEQIDDKEKAVRAVLRAIQLNRDHCGALQLRGQLASAAPKALPWFRDAYKIDKDLITYEGLLYTYVAMRRPLDALEMAKEAKNSMPDSAHARALYGMAMYHAREPNIEEAQRVIQEALKMDPGCQEAADCLVTVYENLKQYHEALQVLEQQLDFQPVDAVHVRRGNIYTTMEQWELALSSYQNALSANPFNVHAKQGIAHVEKALSGGDEEEEEEAEESDNNDEHEVEAMDADLDQEGGGYTRGSLDEEGGIPFGEDEYGEESEDDRQQR
ncbi:Anaphase-promoting complex subunit 7, partial [Modicella reniformis]